MRPMGLLREFGGFLLKYNLCKQRSESLGWAFSFLSIICFVKTDRLQYLAENKKSMKDEVVENMWHVYSDGTRADIPFNSDEDKLYAWNSVAVCAEIAGMSVWVSTVNDTHLHTVVKGAEDRVKRFRVVLQQRLQTRFPGQGVYFACDPIETRDEVLVKFMYVYRNCLDYFKNLPGEYAWGAGNIYFSEKRHFFKGRRIGDLSIREQRRLFHTKTALPGEWMCDYEGRILPESFIDYESVEHFFRSVFTFIAFMHIKKDDEAMLKQQIHSRYLESRSIQDLRRLGNEICVRRCGRKLSKALFQVRLDVAVEMLRRGLSGRSASLAKALILKPKDLDLLV